MSFANYKGEILDISDNFSVPFFTVYFIFSYIGKVENI